MAVPKTTKATSPGLYIDADMTDAVKDVKFLERFTREYYTEAHIDTVMSATHSIFSSEFDKRMKGIASTRKAEFFHVYEYSPTGNGYSWVGRPEHQLWQHVIRGRGANKVFTWNWKPATQFNPNYKQRRMPGPGEDGMRTLSTKDFRELMRKSDAQGNGYRFVWKAPILEYEIQRTIYPRGKRLMLPRNGKKIFATHSTETTMQPGPTKGNFTTQWMAFWTGEVQERFYEVLGKEVERDAARRIEAALNSGSAKPRAERRRFTANAFADTATAKAAGEEQAIAAIKAHRRTIKAIEAQRGRYTQLWGR